MGSLSPGGKINPSLLAIIALLLVLIFIGIKFRGGGLELQDYPGIMAKKMELLSDMRVNLHKSEEAEKSAVMADTDEASRDFADQSRRASDFVERDRLEFESLLKRDHTDKELKLFQEFDTCWTGLQKIDSQVLEFAVQNTNLKAASLAFGKGDEAMKTYARDLENLIHSGPTRSNEKCAQTVIPASDALAAGLRIQVLLAPHIAAASDARMDEIESEIRQLEGAAQASLNKLETLVPEESRASLEGAQTAFEDFVKVTAEVIRLSRENTNIKSFELSLGNKRKIAAQCDDILSNLQETVHSMEFKATR
jgi:hypothetical protein